MLWWDKSQVVEMSVVEMSVALMSVGQKSRHRTEGWHRSLAQIIELAIFLLKDSLHLIIKSAKNNFLTKNYLGLFLDTFSEVVKNEAEKN
jgi:hypothetical protein